MCGIVGCIGLDLSKTAVLKNMTDAIYHRGPDGDGHYYHEDFCFGHRRLSIVDLSDAGSQPMHYLERYVITYNGEIYNYKEIRNELTESGYTFTSDTDTEVIMAAYDYWGVDCLNKFNGMWAFVIYDFVTKKFFISRDRFGIKPLYFYRDDHKLIFASEIKSICAGELIEVKVNSKYIDRYLKTGPAEYENETAFELINRFPYAHYFLGTKDEILTEFEPTRYWHLNVNVKKEPFIKERAIKYAQEYYNLLYDSVKLRLRADVPLGAALSGGLDSSSIVYLINEHLSSIGRGSSLQTFSSVHMSDETKDCDESNYIDLVASFLDVDANKIDPDNSYIPDEMVMMIRSMENPPSGSNMSGWHTFKKVKLEKIIVNLDGQGADEQLGGYLYYLYPYLLSISLKDFPYEVIKLLKVPGAAPYIRKATFLRVIKIFLGERALNAVLRYFKGLEVEFNLNQVLANETQTNLVTLLHYADSVSMHHSVESRMPFMDYRLVEFLASVPACYKIHDGWTKYLARLAFDGKLPDDICWRRDKMGWSNPEEYWFNHKYKSWFVDCVKKCNYFSNEFKNSFDVRFKKGENIKTLLRIVNFSVFYQIYFGGKDVNKK